MALEVTEIENGTVIDHIPAGKGRVVYHLITDNPNNGDLSGEAVVLMNVNSTSSGKKDMLKFENVFVDEKTRNIIALVAPHATINIIKNGKVAEKHEVKMPRLVHGHLKCLNPKCITNGDREPLQTVFAVSGEPVKLTCQYCDKEYDEELVTNL